MIRSVLAVFGGYAVVAVGTVAAVALAYRVLGDSFALTGDATGFTTRWLLVSLPLVFAGGALGGLACRRLAPAPSPRPLLTLAAVVFVLGLVSAGAHLRMGRPYETATTVEAVAVREETADLRAGAGVAPPAWYNLLAPLVAVAGVLAGGRTRRRPSRVRPRPYPPPPGPAPGGEFAGP